MHGLSISLVLLFNLINKSLRIVSYQLPKLKGKVEWIVVKKDPAILTFYTDIVSNTDVG